ncbi:MAG: hypothetical protein ACREOI_33585 [bacterium]
MKKFIRTGLLPLALVFPLLGEDCEKSVDIAVSVATEIPFQINSNNATYSEVDTVDFTGDIKNALADAQVNETSIVDIKIESVTYTVTNYNGAPNTLASGLLRVGPIDSNNASDVKLLSQLKDVDLSAIAGQEEVLALNSPGVAFLHAKLKDAIISNAGVVKAFIDGQVNPAPPSNLDFPLTAKVNLIVVVREKVEVPGGCSNPVE